jgi:hypothetical protein
MDCVSKIPGCDRVLISQQSVHISFKDHLATLSSRSGAKVDDVVRRPNHIGIMFHNDDGVPSFTHLLQDKEETMRIPRVEANARFIQHVKGLR